MRYLLLFKVMVIVLLSVQEAYAQAYIDDRGTGMTDHNYFAVTQSPYLITLLGQVESQHLTRCRHDAGGILGDIAKGRYDLATTDLQYVLRQFVNHPRALMILSSVAIVTKNGHLAVSYFERAIALYPGYALTYYQYGAYLVNIGQVEDGIAKLDQSVTLNPKLTAAYVALSKAYRRNGQVELANQAQEKARELGYKGDVSVSSPSKEEHVR